VEIKDLVAIKDPVEIKDLEEIRDLVEIRNLVEIRDLVEIKDPEDKIQQDPFNISAPDRITKPAASMAQNHNSLSDIIKIHRLANAAVIPGVTAKVTKLPKKM